MAPKPTLAACIPGVHKNWLPGYFFESASNRWKVDLRSKGIKRQLKFPSEADAQAMAVQLYNEHFHAQILDGTKRKAALPQQAADAAQAQPQPQPQPQQAQAQVPGGAAVAVNYKLSDLAPAQAQHVLYLADSWADSFKEALGAVFGAGHPLHGNPELVKLRADTLLGELVTGSSFSHKAAVDLACEALGQQAATKKYKATFRELYAVPVGL